MNGRPVVLCIMDGWGLTSESKGNAPLLAKTPTLDFLYKEYPNSTLSASEEAVGLPAGQMGNSEVGHINLGAGRVVYTGLSLINKCIKDGALESQPAVVEFFDLVKSRGSKLHFLSLISEGGVHSNMNHFLAFADICVKRNQPYILHAFTDGRDVSPNAAKTDFIPIVQKLKDTNGKLGVVSGRYYSMDRDKNWDREEKVFKYLVGSDKSRTFDDVLVYIEQSYASGVTDEFIEPAICSSSLDSVIGDNDVVVFLNFRPDRARQISHMLVGSKGLYDYEPSVKLNNVSLFALMDYEKINLQNTLFPPFDIKNTLGEFLSNNGISQLRIAETEKYPHVTHFFDGGKTLDYPKMKKILIPSPKVATYDLQPEMSAPKITEALLPELKNFEVVILNFANPDMVGHTGSLEATIKACESVDTQIGKIYEEVQKLGGVLVVIADHGNAEVMITADGSPHTAHTTNLVPFIVCKKGVTLRNDGVLGDIAPTLLSLLGLKQPVEMTGKVLVS
ncbi:2,3-bisphosphoglycerate-independent phosphoglycerate mutase [Mycoplasma haemofelis Ohio2]|uniref:2,3-bisphosphoglycerate-independent phosphoglycerate mutase n=1 Tax=Mycoplasma haemofelis (strain Ohio2) TaxID=859194 RepID=F6FHQ8_MYCHI|nr:2,3-bisphosphoglycerate-independent phosphoglycerate mutase [Mycoplasma haemofelis Ohio2]